MYRDCVFFEPRRLPCTVGEYTIELVYSGAWWGQGGRGPCVVVVGGLLVHTVGERPVFVVICRSFRTRR